MNRRLSILYYWLFRNKHNVNLLELCKFIKKPKVKSIGSSFIKNISYSDEYIEVTFNTINNKLYWPRQYDIEGLYQVASETFDIYDWHYYEYGSTKVSKEDVVVDIGCAEGLFSLSIIDRCEKTILIEPNKVFCNALSKTFKDYESKKVELHNVAIGDKKTNIVIKGNALSGEVIETAEGSIKMTTLDNILLNKGRIDYIKADLEGYEMTMLRGAIRVIKSYCPKISITCYHKTNDYKDIISFIKYLNPKYKFYVKGISQFGGKPVMIHFWVS